MSTGAACLSLNSSGRRVIRTLRRKRRYLCIRREGFGRSSRQAYHDFAGRPVPPNLRYLFRPSAGGPADMQMEVTRSVMRPILRRHGPSALPGSWIKCSNMGLIRGATLDNAVCFDRTCVLNPEGCGFRDERCRHKVLDLIGDLALIGSLCWVMWWRNAPATPCMRRWSRASCPIPSCTKCSLSISSPRVSWTHSCPERLTMRWLSQLLTWRVFC